MCTSTLVLMVHAYKIKQGYLYTKKDSTRILVYKQRRIRYEYTSLHIYLAYVSLDIYLLDTTSKLAYKEG